LEISIEDIRKYRGNVCPGVVLSFRATQLAILELWKDEIPKRGDFKITSALPTQGSKDAFEFITRVITREKGANFKLKIPKGADIKNISKDNFTFTFVRKSTNEQIKIRVREGVFPEGFFELRKKVKLNLPTPATQVEKRTFKQTKQRLRNRLLYLLPANKIFEIQE
jgi:formylmethanofuran dehydrogenase subunit E